MKTMMFICGEAGCDIVAFNESDVDLANSQLKRWAEYERQERGDFPPMAEQEIYWAKAMKRVRKLRLRRCE